MPQYMISFNDGDMRFDASELELVAQAAHTVMQEAIEAGVWVFGGGFQGYSPWVVRHDGTVAAGPLAPSAVWIGGFAVVDVENDSEANEWARKIGIACRCNQEVRRFMDDPEQDLAVQRQAHSS